MKIFYNRIYNTNIVFNIYNFLFLQKEQLYLILEIFYKTYILRFTHLILNSRFLIIRKKYKFFFIFLLFYA